MGGREAKTQRYTIGRHGSPWTAATARMEAVRIFTLVRQRANPVDMDKQRRREAVELAFAAYADRFAKSCTGMGWRALVDRSLRLHLLPVLGPSSAERRVGKACVSTCRSRCSRWHEKNKINNMRLY